ncbi:MAG TPA: alkanesulfonate monooxygenase [Runella sp.]|nr:alkanesulfonate monooxygenase [Runella sp.]
MTLSKITTADIRTTQRVAEIAWFNDIIGGDTEYLGILDSTRRSSFEHCRDITLEAERLGFSNILYPTAYTVGQDVLTVTSALAQETSQITFLAAIRTGEIHPPMLARALASLDHQLKGRLILNIINSDLPGTRENADFRYQRCTEVIEILKQAWTQERIQFKGKIYNFDMPAGPVKPYQNGGPLLYFGGTSEGSREVCAKHCDVFLMWPESEEAMYATMQDMTARAAKYGRKIDFGLRIHVVARETQEEARTYAKKLISKFDEKRAAEIRARGEDSRSLGVIRQDEFRKTADDEGYTEEILWTHIGKVFSGCGSGLVGSAEQIVTKLNRYMDMGFRAFIFSGFPLIEEANHFAELVLPHLPNVSLPRLYDKIPTEIPATPLTTAELV